MTRNFSLVLAVDNCRGISSRLAVLTVELLVNFNSIASGVDSPGTICPEHESPSMLVYILRPVNEWYGDTFVDGKVTPHEYTSKWDVHDDFATDEHLFTIGSTKSGVSTPTIIEEYTRRYIMS